MTVEVVGTGIFLKPEGQAFDAVQLVSFSDTAAGAKPGDFQAVIDWGDGTPRTVGEVRQISSGEFGVFGGHLYQEEGGYPVAIDVSKSNSSSDSFAETSVVIVTNGPLVGGQNVTIDATEGEVLADILVAGFVDSGLPDPVGLVSSDRLQALFGGAFTGTATGNIGADLEAAIDDSLPELLGQYAATIDWGDGSLPTTGTIRLDGLDFRVSGSHTYARDGIYSLSVKVTDRGFDATELPVTGSVAGTADLNGDGFRDLLYYEVVAGATNDEIVLTTLLNQGDGTFSRSNLVPLRLVTPNLAGSVSRTAQTKAEDVDGDGDVDLVLGVNDIGVGDSLIYVLLNEDDGQFVQSPGSPTVTTSDFFVDFDVADVDGDGDADLVVATKNLDELAEGSLLVYRNLGNATFALAGPAVLLNYIPETVEVDDWDADGDADLLVTGDRLFSGTDAFDAVFAGILEIRPGTGDSAFGIASQRVEDLGTAPFIFLAADLDGDGDRDLVVAGGGGETLSVLANAGDGTLTQMPGSPVDLSGVLARLGDLAAANSLNLASLGHTFDVILPQLQASLDVAGQSGRAETNLLRLLDLAEFEAYFGINIEAAADFDNDGLIDFAGRGVYSNDTTSNRLERAFFLHGTSAETTFLGVARVANSALLAKSMAISAHERRPLTDVVVGTFSDLGGPEPIAQYTASIDWGDGSAPTLGRLVAGPNGDFVVLGSHTYSLSGTYPVKVTLGETSSALVTAATTSIVSSATVTDIPLGLSVALDPGSDSGLSNSDRITNLRETIIVGTAESGSTVRILARRSGESAFAEIGRGVADGNGRYAIAAASLADGVYDVRAEATDRFGASSESIDLGTLTIDTVAPTLAEVRFKSHVAGFELTFQDTGSGLDARSLIDVSNYRVARQRGRRSLGRLITAIEPSNALSVSLTVNGGRALRRSIFNLRIRGDSNGLRDVAGNAFDGEFVNSVPTGDGRPGGDFNASFYAIHGRSIGPKPLVRRRTPKQGFNARGGLPVGRVKTLSGGSSTWAQRPLNHFRTRPLV